jgi:TPR repeat protein
VGIDDDGKRIRHVLNVAIRDMQAYARLESELPGNAFAIDNLTSEMTADYMVDKGVARVVLECLAELHGYGPFEGGESGDVPDKAVSYNEDTDLQAGLEYYRQLDFYKAQYHLLKAANSANAEAECALGDIFADERNPNHDVRYAVEWYEKAAENGHSRAQWLTGASYLEGVGTEKDLDKAKHWFQKSADQGDADGQYGLAGYYFTVQDYISSVEWLKKAAAQGHEEAREMLERLGV